MKLKSLIQRRKDTCFGQYTLRGTRICVWVIKGMHEGGDSIGLLADLYHITQEQVVACINFRKPFTP